jgi:hypothetical protein
MRYKCPAQAPLPECGLSRFSQNLEPRATSASAENSSDSEKDPPANILFGREYRVPFLAVREVLGIAEDLFLGPDTEHNRAQRTFWARSDQPPFVLDVG